MKMDKVEMKWIDLDECELEFTSFTSLTRINSFQLVSYFHYLGNKSDVLWHYDKKKW